VRIALDIQQRVQRQIDSRNYWTQREPWTFSDFVRVALEDKLAKMARSRRRRGRRALVETVCESAESYFGS
jgi:hypothetical protein